MMKMRIFIFIFSDQINGDKWTRRGINDVVYSWLKLTSEEARGKQDLTVAFIPGKVLLENDAGPGAESPLEQKG